VDRRRIHRWRIRARNCVDRCRRGLRRRGLRGGRVGIRRRARRRIRIRSRRRRRRISDRLGGDYQRNRANREQEESAPPGGRSPTVAAPPRVPTRPQQRLGSPFKGHGPLPQCCVKSTSNVLHCQRSVNRNWFCVGRHASTRRSSAGCAPVPVMTAPIPGRYVSIAMPFARTACFTAAGLRSPSTCTTVL
jgi:hypothetical protein